MQNVIEGVSGMNTASMCRPSPRVNRNFSVPSADRSRADVDVADPPGESVTEESLLDFCAKNLAPYKIPKEIEIVREIPRNAAGKVLRRELRPHGGGAGGLPPRA